MVVELAKYAGFCFGVNKAVETVYKTIEDNPDTPIYTYGPIIHNESVVKELAGKGVRSVSDDELDKLPKGIMIIRSHGIDRATRQKLESLEFTIVDATCPFVRRIHEIVDRESSEGGRILIFGNREHPEVQGIMGWCNSEPYVLEEVSDVTISGIAKDEEICVVAQTTFNLNKFKNYVEKLDSLGYHINVVNTICNATEERQTAARELAGRADCMIVIGGAGSSNSRKLKEICEEECGNTHFIQTLDDLDIKDIETVELVGITAGASTPNYIIEEVQNYVRNEF